MSDLKKYIKKRKEQDKEFANGYDEGYMKEEYDFINSVKNPYVQKESSGRVGLASADAKKNITLPPSPKP